MLTFKLKSQNNHLADSPFELIIERLPPCCQVKVRLDLGRKGTYLRFSSSFS